MGKLIMLKNDGQLESFEETIRVIYENGGVMKTSDFINAIKQIHPHLSTTSCNHKTEASRYFGLVLVNNNTHYCFLTESGSVYCRANNQNKKIDAVLSALTSVTFGRNNNAVNSDSDIEAPIVMLKAIVSMGSASMTQIGLILYYMDINNMKLSDAIKEVEKCEDPSGMRKHLTENQQSKYFDVKFNKLFEDLGIVEKEQGNYTLSKYVKDNHISFINSLPELKPISSIEDTNSSFSCEDFFNHSLYGIHIKEKNDALSDERPHICIGWSGIGDLADIATKDELSIKYDATWPNTNPRKKGQDVGQIWRFINDAQIGDYVIFADNDIFHIGVIDSDYYYDGTEYPEQNNDYTNNRKVIWLRKNLQKNILSDTFRNSLSAGMSFWTLNDYKSAVVQLLNDTYVKDEILLEPEIDMLVEDISSEQIYSANELVQILNEMYTSASVGNQSNAIRMFGFKYAESIMSCGVSPQKIVDDSIIDSTSYGSEINKGISMYQSIKNNEYGVAFAQKKAIEQKAFDYSSTKGEGINKIFYGTPGCGKSHYIEHDILGKNIDTKEYIGDYKKENIIRTTFYQDYSNTDFVGQILPKIVREKNGEKDCVEYIFNPGPFTLALIQAISNPDKKVALVVEEINRGNAPAIFGDIFQLLDRDDDSISEYGIVNVGVMDYLNNYEFTVNSEKKKYIFNEIKIPANMYIYATMNTSDQNVYTLDTAFTRRWEKEKIKNSFDECEFKGWLVPGMEPYTWEDFVNSINDRIDKNLEQLQVNEDKQIGVYFVKAKDLIDKNNSNIPEKNRNELIDRFVYKVFDYLWNDVAKLDRNVFFESFDTLDKLIKAYKTDGVKVFQRGIFAEKVNAPALENKLTQDDDSNE